jgi:two-component sensor histidine kinase
VEVSATFPPDRSSPRAAREFVRDTIDDFGDEEARQNVALLTSELVTNAVLHARTRCEVAVERDGDHVRIAVSDGDSRLPRPSSGPPEATTGRGLHLVDIMATAWGVEGAEDGKFVWFEVVQAEAHG